MPPLPSPAAQPGAVATIDIEASGLGGGSYPIEVGAVLADGRSFCTLVRPEPDWRHWDAQAQALHGLSRELLLQHGKPVAAVAEQLDAFLGGRVVYSDAWLQDFSWLHRLYDAAGRSPSFELASVDQLLGPVAAVRWQAARAAARASVPQARHRASADARVLQLTVQLLVAAPAALAGSADA